MPTQDQRGFSLPAAVRVARSGRTALLVMALLVGAATGLGAVAFRWLIARATLVFSGRADYSAVGLGEHPANPWVPWLGPAFVVLAPVIGGLLYGPLVQRFAREARGHGVPEVMLAVAHRGGRIPGRVAIVKALASALTIGSGGSVGREGPIVQIGSAIGSRLGTALRFPESRLRTLVACGAASGIAATFNAPLAGVLFALELILRDFTAESFGLVVLAAVVASVVGRAILGDVPFLDLPLFEVGHPASYLLFAALGLLAGVVAVVFTRVLYGTEDLLDRIWRGPEWARPAVGGLALGLLLLVVPQMYGVGYPVLESGVSGRFAIGVLLLLLVAKVFATSLTIGIGGSGGVFAPSLFIGGMLGAAFGQAAVIVLPDIAGPPGAFALIGMGAVFAGASRAPITAVLMLFELTGEYTIILPLMLAIVIASGTARVLSRDTIYTLKLRRRGIDLDSRRLDDQFVDRTVAQVMEPAPATVPSNAPLSSATQILLASGRSALPVIEDGRLVGQLRADRIAETLEESDDADAATVAEVLDELPTVGAATTLRRALHVLRHSGEAGDRGLAVVDTDGALVGWLTHRSILVALTPVVPEPPSTAARS